MTVSDGARYRIDDLRRFGSAIGAAAGLTPPRATALAAHLLWFDTAGAPRFGLATLQCWMGRIEQGEVNPKAEGRIASEHAGTAVLEGQDGLAPLILSRAAGVAGEKARDVGVGIVRVTGLGPAGPAAAVAAEMATGPEVACILGPNGAWTLALPSPEALPVVFDSVLAGDVPLESRGEKLRALVAPWASLNAGEGWLVLALAVPSLEPLSTFHERVSAALKTLEEAPGQLLPGCWEDRRSKAREHGLSIDAAAMADLKRCAEKLGIALPLPMPD
jgi:LDH2 family malate/lactate/ureidoglycolate dehydrogenase